ncbi:helix-turn-helix transcriptional regulator [Lysinibacillus sp. FSL M8-0355]|uniref:helix-turn-helix transcriptional regulator n=2 Tax=Lysinibacillus sp. FSL M8-0355 TaxID=2921719 RepID=UPI0030F8D493
MRSVKTILDSYIPFAKAIGEMFGPNCEVIIHDLTTPESSVTYTFNNHVTGRKVGQSFDHLIKKVLLSNDFKDDYLAGYEFQTADNKTIKASTILIRSDDLKVIGALCINYDVNLLLDLKTMIDTLLPNIHANKHTSHDMTNQEENIGNVEEITDQLIDQIISNRGNRLVKRQEKMEVISFMDEKGIFLMKGAVDKVATKLNISKVTVYSYLDEIKKANKKVSTNS